MISKKVRLSNRDGYQVAERKLDNGNQSSRIDAMIRCTQARLNLIRGFSELKAELGIDDEFQQLDMPDKESSVTQIQIRSTNE